jgi:BirA family biotin operon repressor/biotin-[acetyl-CoA-carboxylase] ligase
MTALLRQPVPCNVVWLGQVDSTNLVVARLVEAWADEEDDRLGDTMVVASSQTAGRGRSGHTWESPEGGVYATWLGWIQTADLAWLPIAAGVCLAEAVEATVDGLAARLKWPNDVLVGGAKLGGVLCQSRTRGAAAWVAVGFGVNVEAAPALGAGAAPATCLRRNGFAGPVGEAIGSVVAVFAGGIRTTLGRRGELVAEWLRRSVHRPGDRLRLRTGAGVLEGAYVGMGADGRLELAVGGALSRVAAGELIDALPERAAAGV